MKHVYQLSGSILLLVGAFSGRESVLIFIGLAIYCALMAIYHKIGDKIP